MPEELNPKTSEFLKLLEEDEIMIDLKVQINQLKAQLSVLLANSVKRLSELYPEEGSKADPILVVQSVVDGLCNDLCYQTMDIVDPNWKVDMPDMNTLLEMLTTAMAELEEEFQTPISNTKH